MTYTEGTQKQYRWMDANRKKWLDEAGPCAACGTLDTSEAVTTKNRKLSTKSWRKPLAERTKLLTTCRPFCTDCVKTLYIPKEKKPRHYIPTEPFYLEITSVVHPRTVMKLYVMAVLRYYKGNKSAVARATGMSYRGLSHIINSVWAI